MDVVEQKAVRCMIRETPTKAMQEGEDEAAEQSLSHRPLHMPIKVRLISDHVANPLWFFV
jgi:hypothetical protein